MNSKLTDLVLFILEISSFIYSGYLAKAALIWQALSIFIFSLCLALFLGNRIYQKGKHDAYNQE